MDERGLAWRKAWLAGEALLEAGLNRVQDSALGRDLARRVRYRLADLVRQGRLQPVERAAAGTRAGPPGRPALPGRGLVPARRAAARFRRDPGRALYDGQRPGARPGRKGRARCPNTRSTLPAYWIARYPVTVAQFRAFVQESGHKVDAPWEQLQRHSTTTRWCVVTWYDAMAYCAWLTEQLRERQDTPEPLATLAARARLAGAPAQRGRVGKGGARRFFFPPASGGDRFRWRRGRASTPGATSPIPTGRTMTTPGSARPARWALFPAGPAPTACWT